MTDPTTSSPSTETKGFGRTEGETCWRNGCQGVIELRPVEGCSCHINPPCGACSTPAEFCPECGWEAADEGEHLNGFIASNADPFKWERRPLDPRKIDYHVKTTNTGFTQVCEGVYPEGTTRAEVLALVKGTFGGRFEKFGDGRFRYVAYTD